MDKRLAATAEIENKDQAGHLLLLRSTHADHEDAVERVVSH